MHVPTRSTIGITNEDVQHLKAALAAHSTKTINNVLAVLGHVFSVAIEWEIVSTKPRIKRLRNEPPPAPFYEFDQYARLLEAAKRIDARVHVAMLLGGDAGLRRGEILALRWADVDLRRKQLTVRQSVWREIEDSPKGNRIRHVPLTAALAAALSAHRHLRGAYVLCDEEGKRVTVSAIGAWMASATKRAGLEQTNGLHVLRHTFCSHLAMRGAPVKAIQELAGHADLSQTMRYMHLSPAGRDAAIRLLDARGEGLEKAAVGNR